jgi:ubiquinone/menaquinone biosynthesis C-methylase UbiE
MTSDERQKNAAVAQHSRQAGQFDERCKRALDIGCGTGHHVQWLRARGYDVVGVDGSADMLRRARENNPGVRFEQCDVESLPLPDGAFDLILCIEVLRYLPSPHGALAEMARVLRPGGLVLTTAAPLFSLNAYPLVNRLATALPVRGLVRLRQFFISARGLRRAARRAGLAQVEVHGVYTGPLNWIERLTPRLLPRVLRLLAPLQPALADAPALRGLANMFLLVARKPQAAGQAQAGR